MPRSVRVLTIAAAVAASALVVGVATASADPDPSGDDDDPGRGHEVTLRFHVETSPFSYTDLGEAGPSAADVSDLQGPQSPLHPDEHRVRPENAG